jgi:sulfite reductase beta subunit-like hemoprotein
MKQLLFVVLVFLALCACSSPTPEEMASLAAKGYYEHLLKGEYEQFLEGKAGSDSLPEAYRAQLIAGYKQFVAQQNSLHNGIHDIRVVNARRDTLLNYTNVFLMFCFGDSTNEEIVVPMVEKEGRWRMR